MSKLRDQAIAAREQLRLAEQLVFQATKNLTAEPLGEFQGTGKSTAALALTNIRKTIRVLDDFIKRAS